MEADGWLRVETVILPDIDHPAAPLLGLVGFELYNTNPFL